MVFFSAEPSWPLQLRLETELRHWRAAGARPRLLWRDDDAREPTPALDRLLALADGRPLALAVIPSSDDLRPLAARLAQHANIRVGQHGVSHININAGEGPPSEYRGDVTAADMGQAIAAGKARLVDAGLEPAFFTPPWNACHRHLADALSIAGFDQLWAGPERPSPSTPIYLASEVDVLRWRGGPRFRGRARVGSALIKALRRRRLSGDAGEPVGLLTHHLAHDEPTWRFLAWLLAFADRHFDWVALGPAPDSKPARSEPTNPRARRSASAGAASRVVTVLADRHCVATYRITAPNGGGDHSDRAFERAAYLTALAAGLIADEAGPTLSYEVCRVGSPRIADPTPG